MRKSSEVRQPAALDVSPFQITRRVRLDMHVLRYMAQRLRLHMQTTATDADTTLPSMHFAEEQRSRTHRMVIYNQPQFLQTGTLLFVGFISGLQQQVSPAITQEIYRVDKLFMAELANNPGLLSYSSLELNKGHWYNLVLLSDLAAKTYFKDSSTHRYAAYQLATHYYAWIRLHNGFMSGGLEGRELIVQSTKYYTFPEIGQQPEIQELLYESHVSRRTRREELR